MIIERVTTDDARELLDIYSYYVLNTAVSFEYDVPTLNEFSERLQNISAKYPYIKAVGDSGKILGYAYASPFVGRKAYDWSVETTIYVDKDSKHSGIGRCIYSALEKSLKNIGILNLNACIAYTESEDEYLANSSMHFHNTMGYKLVGTFHKCGLKFNRWYDMIWMEKMIGEHLSIPQEITFGNWSI